MEPPPPDFVIKDSGPSAGAHSFVPLLFRIVGSKLNNVDSTVTSATGGRDLLGFLYSYCFSTTKLLCFLFVVPLQVFFFWLLVCGGFSCLVVIIVAVVVPTTFIISVVPPFVPVVSGLPTPTA